MKEVGNELGGFENPTEGWHNMEVQTNIEWRKDKQGVPTPWLVAPCKVIDSDEEGRIIFPSFNLEKSQGQTSFAKFLYWTGTADVLEKAYKITDDLKPDEWGKKYLDMSVEKCAKLIDSAINKLANKTFRGKIRHEDSKYTDKDGKDQVRTYANLRGLKKYNDKTDEDEGKGSTPVTKQAPAATPAAKEEEEGWG